MAYNGYTNRATWNVSLWLNNHEGSYNQLQATVRQHGHLGVEVLAEKIAELSAALYGDKTPDNCPLSEVNWEELAGNELEEQPQPPTPSSAPLAQFITRYGIAFESHRVASRPDGLMTGEHMTRHFRCRLSREGRDMAVYFSQGSGHTADPTAEDVLDCLASDASTYDQEKDFEGWAKDLGLDTDSRSAERSYKATKRQAQQLRRLLGPAIYEELLYKTERL